VRIAWVVDGDLSQPTGGYVYDRLVVEGLRAQGDAVEVTGLVPVSDRQDGKMGGFEFDAVVGDALCVRELGPGYERVARDSARVLTHDTARVLTHDTARALTHDTARVLLVHHLASWEVERADREAMRALECRAIAASDRLVVTSRTTAARLAAEHPGHPIDVVAPGSDRLPRHPRVSRGDGVVELLFVGSVIPRKRLPMVLDAMERLSDPRLQLTLVGDAGRDPEHARALEARIDDSALLRACVHAAGVLEGEALARRMAQADALVLASSLEGYGMVLTEALHAGLALLASREAASAAGLADGGPALVFDDAHGLTGALRRLLDDPAQLAGMHRAALDCELPLWRQTVDSFRDLLTQALARAKERGPDRAPSP
jgi:glycosyltransferase involved in cell wall biosynthesis